VSSREKNASSSESSATVSPGSHIGGTLEVPGDKSISHRVAIFSALAEGTSSVIGFLQSEDCVNTLRALEAMGASTTFDEDGGLQITGSGGRLMEPAKALDFGNSGTGIRLLAGLVAGQGFPVELAGDGSLTRRPMDRICRPLAAMGAKIDFLGEPDRPPFLISGSSLTGIDYSLPVASAQVKSCLLLATLFAEGTTILHESRPTRDHTERLMRVLDVPIEVDGLQVTLEGCGPDGPVVEATEWYVPGDFSSAAFWIVSAAAREGGRVNIQNVGLNPRRTAFLDVLRRMGAEISIEVISEDDVVEPYGDIRVRGNALQGAEISGDEIPNLIDEIPLVAVLGALAEGETVIRDAEELRVKESDRIACMAGNLRSLGISVEEFPDGMRVIRPARLEPTGPVRSFGDHRIAMSMAILATYCHKPLTIKNIACTETSYPGFWGDLRHLGARVTF